MLDSADPNSRDDIGRDNDATWEAINDATLDDDDRVTCWRNWSAYAARYVQDPWLRNKTPTVKQSTLLKIADRVRTGHFGRHKQVNAGSVEKALRFVSEAIVLDGGKDPRRLDSEGASKELDLSFSRLLRTYRLADPAPQQQLAVLVSTVRNIFEHHSAAGTPKDLLIADLATVVLFYLLRVLYAREESTHQNSAVSTSGCSSVEKQ
jgi:hypothetical protein